MFTKIVDKLADPEVLRTVHGVATVFWFIMAFPSMIFWSNSIPYLVGISVYAVVTGHWSSWQASRVEVKQKLDADVDEVLIEVKEIKKMLQK